MDVLIEHTTVYDYETPSKYVIQSLRKTPRNFEGQFVRTWWIETDPAGAVRVTALSNSAPRSWALAAPTNSPF